MVIEVVMKAVNFRISTRQVACWLLRSPVSSLVELSASSYPILTKHQTLHHLEARVCRHQEILSPLTSSHCQTLEIWYLELYPVSSFSLFISLMSMFLVLRLRVSGCFFFFQVSSSFSSSGPPGISCSFPLLVFSFFLCLMSHIIQI